MCRREAPGVERFARQAENELTVIGLGAQDDLSQAKDFVARYDVSFRMLWDPTFQTWQTLGVPGQPAALLVAADGTPIQSWLGPFDQREVLDLARRA